MNIVGENIRESRKKAGMSQEELAQKIFTTRQTVSNYENGKSNPDMETLNKIAEVLNMRTDALIYEDRSVSKRKKAWWCISGFVIGLALLITMDKTAVPAYIYDGSARIKPYLWMYTRLGLIRPLLVFALGWLITAAVLGFMRKERIALKQNRGLFWVLMGILCVYAAVTAVMIVREIQVLELSQGYSIYSSILQIPVKDYWKRGILQLVHSVSPWYILMWFGIAGIFARLFKPETKEE